MSRGQALIRVVPSQWRAFNIGPLCAVDKNRSPTEPRPKYFSISPSGSRGATAGPVAPRSGPHPARATAAFHRRPAVPLSAPCLRHPGARRRGGRAGGHRLTRVRRRAARAASAVEVARRASTRAALLVRSSRRTDPSSSCEGTHSDAGASAHAYWGRRGSGRVERRRDGVGDGNLDPRGGFVLPHYPAFSCPRRDRVSDVPGVGRPGRALQD